jgi:hypothetical protein
MSEVVHYGQMPTEKLAEEKEICRKIVREISNFGVSQRQQLFIIYLMSLELENVEHMQTLTSIIRELGGQDLFLIDRTEG